TVVEMLDDVLPGYEDDVAAVVRERAEDLGIDFHFGEAAEEWEPVAADGGPEATGEEAEGDDDGDEPTHVRVVTEDTDGERTEFVAEKCLVAVGREPVTDTVAPGEAGVEVDDDGFFVTDEQGRTTAESIFAVGDAAGEPMLAHAAMTEGEVAADAVAGEPAALDQQATPAAVFTDPEIGTVGMTESEAEEAAFEPVVGRMPLRANGRALTVDEKEGFVRIVADADSEFLLGAQIVGPEASELIAEIGLAIEMGARLEDVAATVHTHPTLSEAVHEAALAARGEAIHTQ
ncbi:MAG: FAD-dependent oxidoreductase, partial [Haloarculaceae archaeon]